MKKRKAKKTAHRSLKSAMKAIKTKAKPAQLSKPQLRKLSDIKVGKRHRKDFGDVAGLARSIEERGALLQPIVITKDNQLIAGERRIKAWQLTRFALDPIPVHVVDIDAIIAGEWDENAQRKDFTPTEAVAIRDEIEKKLKVLAKERKSAGVTAPAGEKGRAGDQAARFTGKARRTLDKAKEIVEAAKADPKKFGGLKDDMNRSGRVDGPHKRLKIMQQTDAIRAAPPAIAFEGKRKVVVVDYPWPNEPDMTQAELDAAGRSLRPYPAMAIEEGCKFMAEQVAPILDEDCVIWFCTTNYHLINGHAGKLLHALGFDERSTMLTWDKVLLGRGQVLREVTEHVIVAFRGKPVINILGKDPPTTLLRAKRRDNSQKPDEFYRLVERVTPAGRYASIFSRGGEGELWDSHGNEVGKYAPMVTPPAPVAPPRPLSKEEILLAALKAIKKGKEPVDVAAKVLNKFALKNPKTGRYGLIQRGRYEMRELEATVEEQHWLRVLLAVDAPDPAASTPLGHEKAIEKLREMGCVSGKTGVKLAITKKGQKLRDRLSRDAADRAFVGTLPAAQVDRATHYVEALRKRHDALVAGDRAAYEQADNLVSLIGDREGSGTDSKLVAAAAAPIGVMPFFGQRGMWQTEFEGIPVIIATDGEGAEISAFAVDPDKPFAEDSGDLFIGYFEHNPFSAPFGKSVEDFIAGELRSAFSRATKGKLKLDKLPKPKQVWQVPEAWPKMPFWMPDPKKVKAKAARNLLAKAKVAALADPKSGLVDVGGRQVPPAYVTPGEALALRGAGPGIRALAVDEKTGRPLRDDGYPTSEHAPEVITWAEQNGHVVSMTIDKEGWSVGACSCEKPGAHWRFPRGEWRNMDAAIDAHWRGEMEAAGVTPPAKVDVDQLEIPLDLRRTRPVEKPAAEAAE